ncbi:MAG: hypothetical protein AABX66_02350 [Nanoarchaeota archaeon]
MIKQSKSLQLRRRYLLIEAKSKEEVEKVIQEAIGSIGLSRAKPMFVSGVNSLVLAIDRQALNDVRAAIELSNSSIKIKKVSGTLKGLE